MPAEVKNNEFNDRSISMSIRKSTAKSSNNMKGNDSIDSTTDN